MKENELIYYSFGCIKKNLIRSKTRLDPKIIENLKFFLNLKSLMKTDIFKYKNSYVREYIIDLEVLESRSNKEEFKERLNLLYENSGENNIHVNDVPHLLYVAYLDNSKFLNLTICEETLNIIFGDIKSYNGLLHEELYKINNVYAENLLYILAATFTKGKDLEYRIEDMKFLLYIPENLNYSKFKKKYIYEPIKIINEITCFYIGVEEIKENNVTKELKFNINIKDQV